MVVVKDFTQWFMTGKMECSLETRETLRIWLAGKQKKISPQFEVIVPDDHARPNHVSATQMYLFCDQIKYGLTLPLSRQIKDICSTFKVIPTMLTPNNFSIINGLAEMFAQAGVSWSIETFNYFAQLRSVSPGSPFVYFCPRHKNSYKAVNMPKGIPHWKRHFFLAACKDGAEWGISTIPHATPPATFKPKKTEDVKRVLFWMNGKKCMIDLEYPLKPVLRLEEVHPEKERVELAVQAQLQEAGEDEDDEGDEDDDEGNDDDDVVGEVNEDLLPLSTTLKRPASETSGRARTKRLKKALRVVSSGDDESPRPSDTSDEWSGEEGGAAGGGSDGGGEVGGKLEERIDLSSPEAGAEGQPQAALPLSVRPLDAGTSSSAKRPWLKFSPSGDAVRISPIPRAQPYLGNRVLSKLVDDVGLEVASVVRSEADAEAVSHHDPAAIFKMGLTLCLGMQTLLFEGHKKAVDSRHSAETTMMGKEKVEEKFRVLTEEHERLKEAYSLLRAESTAAREKFEAEQFMLTAQQESLKATMVDCAAIHKSQSEDYQRKIDSFMNEAEKSRGIQSTLQGLLLQMQKEYDELKTADTQHQGETVFLQSEQLKWQAERTSLLSEKAGFQTERTALQQENERLQSELNVFITEKKMFPSEPTSSSLTKPQTDEEAVAALYDNPVYLKEISDMGKIGFDLARKYIMKKGMISPTDHDAIDYFEAAQFVSDDEDDV